MMQMARSKKACIVFFDEVDAIGGARFDDGVGGDNEVQRTMLEIVNQLDGFDARGNIKVLMATNRLFSLSVVSFLFFLYYYVIRIDDFMSTLECLFLVVGASLTCI